MNIKVSKFGGSSLADASQFKKVKSILLSDPERRYVVPSAPGKRDSNDTKVTDMLIDCYKCTVQGQPIDAIYDKITERYLGIIYDLQINLDLRPALSEVKEMIISTKSPDYAASRGEYLNGLILAAYLGWTFIDAAEVIFFDNKGTFNSEITNDVLSKRLALNEYAVIPGFYGRTLNGDIKTFSRGGSDITGAVVARAAGACIYENWTDVSGFLMADPRIVENPKPIAHISYRELRELSYMGATVLHEDAIFPVRKAGIPTNIKNTNDPSHPGTMIELTDTKDETRTTTITGIAGRKNFTFLSIEKGMMNSELGFGRRVLQALEEYGISFEHMPTGIDTMCVIISDQQLAMHQEALVARIKELCNPDTITLHTSLALIATVGMGMAGTLGTAAKLFSALSEAGVNVRMIDQGSSELNIIVGVHNDDFEKAVRAIYARFVDNK